VGQTQVGEWEGRNDGFAVINLHQYLHEFLDSKPVSCLYICIQYDHNMLSIIKHSSKEEIVMARRKSVKRQGPVPYTGTRRKSTKEQAALYEAEPREDAWAGDSGRPVDICVYTLVCTHVYLYL
jgi:hypothetical protein